jgi:cytochrome c-type biogenesis protein CcmH
MAMLSAAMLLGVGGFTLYALWESLSPPAGPVRAGDLQLQLSTTPHPARVGENQVEIGLRQEGQAVADARVEFRYSLDPLSGGGALEVAEAEPLGGGRYRGAVAFSRPGPWQLTVLVKRPGRADVEASYTFNLALDAAATIAGRIRLRPGLEGLVKPGAALFIFARRGPGPPVAAKRIAAPEFPLQFALSQADAMAGGAFEGELMVAALLKMDGQAGPPAAGDLEGRAPGLVRVGTRDLVIEMDRAR